ncbi:Protein STRICTOSIDINE SYNTHASE-LIKE 10 [Ancistrocladus abbreviatus]
MSSKQLELAAATIAVLVIVFTLYLPTFLPPPTLPAARDLLHAAEIIQVNGAFGPESLVFDPTGEGPYTGVADGRILKWQQGSRTWVDFAFTSSQRKECVRPFAPELEHICGRPLGLRFDQKTGDLYIADAYFGLLVVGPEGGLATSVATEAESQPFYFTNDMDIDEEEDVIYFTDTSTSFRRREFIQSIFSWDKTGRLMKYDKSSKEVTVLLQGLAFANGVALCKDRSFVLVAETTSSRILRYWLKGPNAGNVDTFVDLPGYPDNIRRNSKGEFWVALHAKQPSVANWILSNPWAGKALLKLPINFKQLHVLLVGGKPHATAVKLSGDGQILDILEDSEGKSLKFISEIEERNGKLWIASVMMPFIGTYDLY